jgi:hypothetical protein
LSSKNSSLDFEFPKEEIDDGSWTVKLFDVYVSFIKEVAEFSYGVLIIQQGYVSEGIILEYLYQVFTTKDFSRSAFKEIKEIGGIFCRDLKAG